MRWITIALIGIAGGFASGLFGVGGGVLFVPLLILFLNLNTHSAIGTSLAAIIPTALVGSFRHLLDRQVDLKIAFLLAVFASLGAWLGAGISLQLDALVLRRVFALLLIFIAFRLAFTQ